MRQWLRAAVVALICVVLSAWLFYRYFVIVPISAISGHQAHSGVSFTDPAKATEGVLSDADLAEMGIFAKEPRFRHIVELYVDDLVAYKKLRWTEINSADSPARIQRTIFPLLSETLRHSSCGVSDPERRYSSSIVKALSEAAGLSVCRCAGMSARAYIEGLDSHYIYSPNWYGKLLTEYTQLFPGRPAPTEDASQVVLTKAFIDIDKASQPFWSSNDVVAISTDASGFRASINEVSASQATAQSDFIMRNCLTPVEKRFFEGGMAEGELVMTAPSDSNGLILPTGQALHGEVWLIVKTRGHDMYPITFYYGYDIKAEKWWLQHVNRWCSLRMINNSMSLLF